MLRQWEKVVLLVLNVSDSHNTNSSFYSVQDFLCGNVVNVGSGIVFVVNL
jgi:hypothetical protein